MYQDISKIKQRELLPGIKGRFVHTENNTIGFVELEAGALLPEHAHLHEQPTLVNDGKLDLIIDGKTNILEPGMVITIPSNILHSARAITSCKVTDVFCPVREDYK